MLYSILYHINQLLLRFGCEIRKKQSAPFYYLQHFKAPDLPNEGGVYTIPIDKIISPHFFSYGEKGWHYYTACLREYERNPDITYETSILKKYYDHFQPKTVADILFYDAPKNAPDVLQNMPALLIRDFWRLDGGLEEIKSHLLDEETQLFGPISDIYGEEQFIRCVTAHRMIKKHGYLPDRFEDGYIGGYFLMNGSDYRFLSMAGKHRLAALGVLDIKNIKVTTPYNLKILDIQDIKHWPTVQSGFICEGGIKKIFQRAFSEDGAGFAQYYSLLG